MLQLSRYQNLFSKGYGEIRFQENRDLRISFLNGQLTTNLSQTKRGVSARSFQNGFWGFSSHSVPNENSIEKAWKEASRNADFLGTRGKNSNKLTSSAGMKVEKNFSTKQSRKPVSYWIQFLQDVDQLMKEKFPDLVSRQVTLAGLDMEKNLLTSEGSEVRTLVPRAHLLIQMTKNSPRGPVSFREILGGLGQPEDHFLMDAKNLLPLLQKTYDTVSEKANGTQAEAGVHEVILASDLAGILAHEAVGHTTEADLVLGGSVAGRNLNQRVASDLVTLVDFAHTALGETCPQPIYIDDEGTQSEDTVIIENGLLKTFMNNKETSHHFDQKATGHARAFTFSDEPLIRMRNTAILPGKSKLQEMIASVEKGYLLMRPGNGQADTTGEFMFAVDMGYEIKNGKLGRAIQNTTISGVAFEMLQNVTMVSDEFKWESAGYCGKKQPMPVGMGGPSIKTRIQIGGR